MKQEYKELLEDNNPLLTSGFLPCLKKVLSSKITFYCLVIVAICGLIFTISYMIFEDKKTINKILLARESTLNTALTKVENQNDILEAEILLLKDNLISLSKKREQQKLAKISKYLANKELVGRGIIITLTDNPSTSTYSPDEDAIIHNTDLLKIVNFLWSQEAKGICINDVRITPNTHISCVGATILINKKRINAPFIIKAVGEKIKKNEVADSGIVLSLRLRGIEFQIEENDEITVPAGK